VNEGFTGSGNEGDVTFADLAGVLGVHLRQVAELPRLLPLVEVSFVGLLHLHHFDLDGPLRGHWDNNNNNNNASEIRNKCPHNVLY